MFNKSQALTKTDYCKYFFLPFPEECHLYYTCHRQLDKLGTHPIDETTINQIEGSFLSDKINIILIKALMDDREARDINNKCQIT